MTDILIYAEITKSDAVHPVFFELAAKARTLKGTEQSTINALLIGAPGSAEKFKEELGKCGCDKVFVVEDKRLAEYNTDFYTKAAVDIIKEIEPSIVLIGATNQGRDLAPRVASELKTGLTADCTELEIIEDGDDGKLAATRPTFGGELMATILCKTAPQMATVRPNVFKPLQENSAKNTEFIYKKPKLEGVEKRVELLEFVKSASKKINRLEHAQVIVAGGVGMKSAEGFKLLEELALCFNGAVGATRAAVDRGFAPREKQIGQTGLTVSPKLYIACGISGAIQHIVGMQNSDKIIAINTNPKAPIFEVCDLGYVGDVFEVLPMLVKSLTV